MVDAIDVSPRSATGKPNVSKRFILYIHIFETDCALLSNKIYCYGGSVMGDISNNDALIVLDMAKNKDTTSYQSLNSQWDSIPIAMNFGKRSVPQVASMPDGKRLLIYGGYNSDATTKLSSQTIAYNTETDVWESLPSFNDAGNGGDRQMYVYFIIYKCPFVK